MLNSTYVTSSIISFIITWGRLPFMPVFKTWDGNILDYSQYSFRIFSKLVSTLFLKLFPPLLNSHPIFYGVCSTDTYFGKKCKCSNKGRLRPMISMGLLKVKQMSDLNKLINDGQAYGNLHTQANRNGEIRGQIST